MIEKKWRGGIYIIRWNIKKKGGKDQTQLFHRKRINEEIPYSMG